MTAPRCLAWLVAAAALAGGCGSEEEPLPFVCKNGSSEGVATALREAPDAVVLDGGVRISQCIRVARSDADLQNVGAVLTGAAEHLEERAVTDETAALQLGYLVGAARRGASRENGIQAELVRRLERSAALDGATPGAKAALTRGLAAGEGTG